MKKKYLMVMCLIASMFCAVVAAQTVDEIVNKNIKAMGGLENLKSLKSLKITGDSMMQGIDIPIVMQIKKPNMIRSEMMIQGQLTIQAFDGTTAWQVMPMMGVTEPQIIPDEDAQRLKEEAEIEGPLLDYKQKGNTVELMGKEVLDGTDVYNLKITKKNGDVSYAFIDYKNYPMIKQTNTIKRDDKVITVETLFSDFKNVGGLVIPHSIISKVNGQEFSQFVLTSFEINAKIDEAIFKMPVPAAKKEDAAKPAKNDEPKSEKQDTPQPEKK